MALVGICVLFLLYRWRKQQKRQQGHALYPEPFDSTLTRVDWSLKDSDAAIENRSLHKLAGEIVTPGTSLRLECELIQN